MTDYSKIDRKVINIVKKISLYKKTETYDEIYNEIKKAYDYAKEAHEGQLRKSGDPYIIHPVEASEILIELKPDLKTIQACLLHDVVEDTPRTIDDIRETFGEEVAFLCDGMEKISKVRYRGEERNIGSLRKMFVAMAQDLRVIFIKLSDRLHNMKTLKHLPKPEKQERIAKETLNIYAPIADRLGLYNLKNALEGECFKILQPLEYNQINRELKKYKPNIDYFYGNAKKELEEILKTQIENFNITYRFKSIYSIYKKMKKKNYENMESMYDLFGMKVLVDDISDCYKVLGLIHNKWSPIPNRFKDYIALPKPNGYRSLHTTIIGFLKRERQLPTEIQIRTFEMNEYADIGVAAHFEYKEKGSQELAQDIDWVKELKNLTENLGNNDFISSLKIDVFKNRIFVFTPKGLSINLPAGSTPIDFAYAIHSEIGNHTIMAKVDGRVYPLDKELTNGSIVEILTDENKKASPFWLSFVKTTTAKEKIRTFLKKENKDVNIERGKNILNRYLEKINFPILDKDLTILKSLDDRINSMDERNSILEQVGNFSVNPSSIVKKILKAKNIKTIDKKEKDNEKKVIKKQNIIKKEDIIIGGEKDIDYRLCRKCISKKIPEKIVGHINSKGIVTVHNRSCSILKKVNKERLLPAYRLGEEGNYIYISVNFTFFDKLGLLKELSDIIFSMNINIEEIKSKKINYKNQKLSLKLEIPDHDYLLADRLIERVKLHFGENLLESEIGSVYM